MAIGGHPSSNAPAGQLKLPHQARLQSRTCEGSLQDGASWLATARVVDDGIDGPVIPIWLALAPK